MLLSPARVLELCQQPAGAAFLTEGRRLERRHRLHLDGDADLLRQFFDDYQGVMTPEARKALGLVAVPATKPLFGAYADIFAKIFSARGGSTYFEFADPELADAFEQYLVDNRVLHELRQRWQRAALTGFQGVFVVDLPAAPDPDDEYPQPYVTFVPSGQLHDVYFTGDLVEYVIVKMRAGEPDEYLVCFDDETTHVVRKNPEGQWAYAAADSVAHQLGYVPAFPPTLQRAAAADAVRTSIFDNCLPTADVYLRDHAEHQLSKKYHAFPKMWSYAVPCEYRTSVPAEAGCDGEARFAFVACQAGQLTLPTGEVKQCPNCRGRGKFIPTGPDQTYLLNLPPPGQPQSIDIRPPAGYIVPDIQTLKQQADGLSTQELALEKAALGKEGVLAVTYKQETLGGKEIDMQPVYDRLKKFGESWQHVKAKVVETLARLRYRAAFVAAQIVVGDKFQLKSAAQLEADYKVAKEAGVDDAQLLGLLEDILYTRYQDDPRELEYQLLKLHLTPVPTRSASELLGLLTGPGAPQLPGLASLIERKLFLNDYVARFERENGPLVRFGITLPFASRIQKINETFKSYDDERTQVPA